MQSTPTVKLQINNLLHQVQTLIEEGAWTCDELANGHEDLEDCKEEMLNELDKLGEIIGYYMDGE